MKESGKPQVKKQTLSDLMLLDNALESFTAAFAEGRADFDIGTNPDQYYLEIESKRDITVGFDIIQQFALQAATSSGVIRGSRGSGKSHWSILSTNEINHKRDSLAVYINLKSNMTELDKHPEIFENLLKQQIFKFIMFKSSQSVSFFSKITKQMPIIKENPILSEALKHDSIYKKISAWLDGCKKLAPTEIKLKIKDVVEIAWKDIKFGQNGNNNLNASDFRINLSKLRNDLSLKNIVIFVDEWMFLNQTTQRKLSDFLSAINDNPIRIWISYVPGFCDLGKISTINDLPGMKDLDKQLIFEDMNKVDYDSFFSDLLQKRVSSALSLKVDAFTIVKQSQLHALAMASMGNPRDFLLLMHDAWQSFMMENHAKEGKAGRKFSYIHLVHTNKAIATLGEKKIGDSTISTHPHSRALLNHLLGFVKSKKSSHFAVDTKHNEMINNSPEFQALLNARLLFLRKQGIPRRDSIRDIYSLDYSTLKQEKLDIYFKTSRKDINNSARDIVCPIETYISGINIKKGSSKRCSNSTCGEILKASWKLCPECGTPSQEL